MSPETKLFHFYVLLTGQLVIFAHSGQLLTCPYAVQGAYVTDCVLSGGRSVNIPSTCNLGFVGGLLKFKYLCINAKLSNF